MDRRQFLQWLHAASLAGLAPGWALAAAGQAQPGLYDIPRRANVRLLHITDTHAQLRPVYFREPNVNIGVGRHYGQPPHRVGRAMLDHFGIDPGGRKAHAFSYLDYVQGCSQYGRMGGFAHLKTLVDRLRREAGDDNAMLLDGGDLLQGSATALWSTGQDMVGAANRLGVDYTTAHWEFTYPEERIRANIDALDAEFLAQNVFLSPDALFAGAPAYDQASGRVFKPYSMRECGGRRIAVIGQAFPYTRIANPGYLTPDWRMGLREQELQAIVETVRGKEKADAVVLLSHNGMDVDLKMASRVTGLDAILGGHTHDVVPSPTIVENPSGKTIVANGGSNGKTIGVLDLEVGKQGVKDYHYDLLPVFADLIEPDAGMADYIDQVRAPHADTLGEQLAVSDELLYRRGNFNGPFDQLICNALRQAKDADIAFSPGFRWGTTLVPGQAITMEDVLNETAITYPETYVRQMSGREIKAIMADVCDNLFNKDPYQQQGGDMMRIGGMDYVCDPTKSMHHRISDLRLDNGDAVDPDKQYKVAGWATVNSKATGAPVWEVVADYLRSEKTVRIDKLNTPRLKNVDDNPGIADYPGLG